MIRVVGGATGRALAEAVVRALGARSLTCTVDRFPDGELRPRIGPVHGDDVVVVAPTGPPVDESLVELMLLLDAARRGGAARTTAVVPYFGYARQDRRTAPGEALGARVVADALTAAGAQRVVVVDPHTPGLESTFAVPVETPTAVPVLAAALRPGLERDTTVLAPDLGAVSLAERFCRELDLSLAVVVKTRVSGSVVRATRLVGDVADQPVLIVDDMITTGSTVEAATRIALDHGARPGLTVAATHAVLVGDVRDRLGALPLRRVVVTDTVGVPAVRPWLEVCSVAPLIAQVLRRPG